MKKRYVFIISNLLFFICLGIHPQTSSAEIKNDVKITTEYKLYDSLSAHEKNSIIKGEPSFTIEATDKNVILVYQNKKYKDLSYRKSDNQKMTESYLPNTGENNNNLLVFLSIIFFIILILIYKKHKNKNLNIFLIGLIVSGLLPFSCESNAMETNLRRTRIDSMTVGSMYSTEIPLDGYEYIGYIRSGEGVDPNKKSNVTIKYQDIDGNRISEDIVKPGNIGDTYTSEELAIEGYTFKEIKGKPIGKFTLEAQTITYFYTKNPVIGADVTIKYQDIDGNRISEDIVKSGNIGDTYTSEELVIEGYTFKEIKGKPIGKFTLEAQTITYFYTKNPVIGADVTIKYQDIDGNRISEDIVKSGNIGDTYTSEELVIEGYTFKESNAPLTGSFTSESKTIILVYDRIFSNGIITLEQSGFIDATNRGYIKPNFYKVIYYDLDGNILKNEEIYEDTTISNQQIPIKIGDPYNTYARVSYKCYSVVTGDRLPWGDYELVANNPILTKGIMMEPTLTITYTFKDLSYP